MSAEATGYVWRHSRYQHAELLVHLAIADVVNDAHGNEFYMSVGNLARKARVSRSTAFAALQTFCENGDLTCVKPGGDSRKPTLYRFEWAVPMVDTAPTAAMPTTGTAIPTVGTAIPTTGTALYRSSDPNSIELKRTQKNAAPPWIETGISWDEWVHQSKVGNE